MQILKALNDEVAHTGAHASEVHSTNVDTLRSYQSAHEQLFFSPENDPGFEIITTV